MSNKQLRTHQPKKIRKPKNIATKIEIGDIVDDKKSIEKQSTDTNIHNENNSNFDNKDSANELEDENYMEIRYLEPQEMTVKQLKLLLAKNDQLQTGNKSELIERVNERIRNGAIPRCPKCFVGKLKISKSKYYCVGGFDDNKMIPCHAKFSFNKIKRTPWNDDLKFEKIENNSGLKRNFGEISKEKKMNDEKKVSERTFKDVTKIEEEDIFQVIENKQMDDEKIYNNKNHKGEASHIADKNLEIHKTELIKEILEDCINAINRKNVARIIPARFKNDDSIFIAVYCEVGKPIDDSLKEITLKNG